MKMKMVKPPKRIVRARMKILDATRTVAGDLSSEELLAVLSYTVGQCLALQDQRSMTPEQGIALIQHNIQQGNLDAIQNIMSAPVQGSA